MLVYIPKPLVEIFIMDKKEESIVDGVKLLNIIANKENDMDAAKKAFILFIGYFESKIRTFVEVYANKIGYDENVAFEAIQCAFNKVWNYPTFDMKKSSCKNEEKAIIIWLMSIAASQMHQYSRKGECAQIKTDEDLSVIETSDDFVSFHIEDLSFEQKMEYVLALNKKLSVLDEKHRIIYLTYKAYQTRGKKLPRKLLDKLRKRLDVSQVTIRVYKREACLALNDLELLKA